MNLDTFARQKYLSIESYRKDGTAVRTPVWFAQEGETLYVWTRADSGKAKRIRREGRIRIAPCKADGTLLGEWIEARAQADASPEALAHVQALMRRKYGLAFLFFRLLGRGRAYTALVIRPQMAELGQQQSRPFYVLIEKVETPARERNSPILYSSFLILLKARSSAGSVRYWELK
jgi:PPOX class probable F420-dependent enzyme